MRSAGNETTAETSVAARWCASCLTKCVSGSPDVAAATRSRRASGTTTVPSSAAADRRRHPDAGQSSRKRMDVNACGSPRSTRTVSRRISIAFIGGRRTPPPAPRVGAIPPGSFPAASSVLSFRFAATSQRTQGPAADSPVRSGMISRRHNARAQCGVLRREFGSSRWGGILEDDNGVGGGGGEVSLEQRSRGAFVNCEGRRR